MKVGRLAKLGFVGLSVLNVLFILSMPTTAAAMPGASTKNLQADMPLPRPRPTFVAHAARQAPAGEASDERELRCLAEALYFEARGEPAEGQVAVGQVILNRVASAAYPDTICDVVYQNAHLKNRCQFSFACDDLPETIAETAKWQQILVRARRLIACGTACEGGASAGPLSTSTHYHADYVSPTWAAKLTRRGQVGRHIFYEEGAA